MDQEVRGGGDHALEAVLQRDYGLVRGALFNRPHGGRDTGEGDQACGAAVPAGGLVGMLQSGLFAVGALGAQVGDSHDASLRRNSAISACPRHSAQSSGV